MADQNHLRSLAEALLGKDETVKKLAVWDKGQRIMGWDPAIWRRDEFGNVIRYSDYGNRQSDHGWEFDHVMPSILGGVDDVANLRPLHCRENASLGGVLGGLFGGLPR